MFTVSHAVAVRKLEKVGLWLNAWRFSRRLHGGKKQRLYIHKDWEKVRRKIWWKKSRHLN